MADIKWSAFPSTVSPGAGDVLVGLHAGANTKFTGLTIPFSPTVGGTGVANAVGKTITLGAALTTSGAFASTFTMTGVTSVTFPTSGILQTTAGASGIVNSGLINQLGYYAGAGTTISGLATANNGLLVTSATGVPSIGNAILADITVNSILVGRGTGNINGNTGAGAGTLAGANSGAGQNSAFGYASLSLNTTGSNGSAFGFTAMQNLLTGIQNTGIGSLSLQAGTAFNYCTALGYASLQLVQGNGNTGVGYGAGVQVLAGQASITTGSYNTFLGYGASISSGGAAAVGVLSLGALASATPATGATSITNGAGIAIGSATYPVGFRGDGTIYPTASVGAGVLPVTFTGYWRVVINGTTYKIPLYLD